MGESRGLYWPLLFVSMSDMVPPLVRTPTLWQQRKQIRKQPEQQTQQKKTKIEREREREEYKTVRIDCGGKEKRR